MFANDFRSFILTPNMKNYSGVNKGKGALEPKASRRSKEVKF